MEVRLESHAREAMRLKASNVTEESYLQAAIARTYHPQRNAAARKESLASSKALDEAKTLTVRVILKGPTPPRGMWSGAVAAGSGNLSPILTFCCKGRAAKITGLRTCIAATARMPPGWKQEQS